MPNKFIELDFEDWLDTYKPIINHLDPNASFQDETGNGIMFETYGEEVTFVKQQDPATIWTYASGDDGATYVFNGWGLVNRLGYFITEVPCPIDTDVQVMVGEPDLTCNLCDDILEEDLPHLCEEQ